jgi:hypothetical protein
VSGQPLTPIFGTLSSTTDIDIFVINISNPALFSATTVNALTGGNGLDTALFLFDSSGRPVYANDDDAGGLSIGSTLPAGNSLGPQVAGLYYLAISLSGAEPVNFANQLLFLMASSTSLRGPNPNAVGPLADWDTSLVGTQLFGDYQIDLTGAETVPEPSTAAYWFSGFSSRLGDAAAQGSAKSLLRRPDLPSLPSARSRS